MKQYTKERIMIESIKKIVKLSSLLHENTAYVIRTVFDDFIFNIVVYQNSICRNNDIVYFAETVVLDDMWSVRRGRLHYIEDRLKKICIEEGVM